MNTSDSLGSEQDIDALHLLSTREGWPLLLKNTAIRQQLLSHPLLVDTLVGEAVRRSGLSCLDVEERLPAFIDAETSETVRADHQALRLHIHACPWCYDIYAVTHEILDAQKDGTLPPWPS